MCKENLAKFEWRDIITGDESWIYYIAIGHIKSYKSWVTEGESARTVVKRNQFKPKSMFTVFFRSTSFVFVDCLESGKTISAKYYCDNCLKPLIQKVTELRVIKQVLSSHTDVESLKCQITEILGNIPKEE
jgi:hypothetical protein